MEAQRYTTERGVVIRVVPIPLLLDEIRKAHPMPNPPVHPEKRAGGAVQDIPITDEMAETWARESPDTWAQHAEEWATYVQERDAAQAVLNDRIWQATLRKAVKVTLPKDEGWIADQELFGLTVPDDPRERRLHYVRTEAIGGLPDILKITALASGADLTEEALSLAEASFRDSLAGTLLAGLAGPGGAVAAGAAGRAGAGGEGMGAPAE